MTEIKTDKAFMFTAVAALVLMMSVFADSAQAAGRAGAQANGRAQVNRPAAARPGADRPGSDRPGVNRPAAGNVDRTTTVQRTDTGHTSHTVLTGENGKTATRDVVVTNDAANKTRTREVDMVGPNGNTRSVDTVTQKTDDGFTRTTTATGPNGGTATHTVDRSCDKSTKSCTTTVENEHTKP